MSSVDNQKYFIALDLGTSSTRAHVIDKNFLVVSSAVFCSELIQTENIFAELDPVPYFESIVRILREAVQKAGIQTSEIISLGISCQRSTFITWDKTTGRPFHNLITWKDRRAIDIVDKFNNSLFFKSLNNVSKLLYAVTHSDFFKATSKLKMANTWVNHRLQFFLKNNQQLMKAVKENRALYGGLDTWLLSKLKNTWDGSDHISDITSSAATGIYDVFHLDFSPVMLGYFGISRKILPKVVSNFHDFGYTHESVFGIPVRIDVVMSDQSASLVANRCFAPWSSKITLGTGAFLHLNVGDKCLGSSTTANPLIAWSIKNQYKKSSTMYKLEYFHESSSDSIKFMLTAGLCSDVKTLSEIAKSVDSADGVFFIPEYFGFVDIKQTTQRAHLVRAVLENIIFTICDYIFSALQEPSYRPSKIRIDGGISQCDFVCQQIASLSGIDIERAKNCSELTSVGCAILCAYKCGMLKSLEESENFYESEKIFTPDKAAFLGLRRDYQKFLRVAKNSNSIN